MAYEAGADMLGLIFVPTSKRNVRSVQRYTTSSAHFEISCIVSWLLCQLLPPPAVVTATDSEPV